MAVMRHMGVELCGCAVLLTPVFTELGGWQLLGSSVAPFLQGGPGACNLCAYICEHRGSKAWPGEHMPAQGPLNQIYHLQKFIC